MRKRYFFLTSGGYSSLPLAELKAILEAEETPFKVIWDDPQFALLDVKKKIHQTLGERSAFTKIIGLYMFDCRSKTYDIQKIINKISLPEGLSDKTSFSVRVKKVQDSDIHLDSSLLEPLIGEALKSKFSGLKVNLENPEIEFIGILTRDKFVFGRKIYERSKRKFYDRQPKLRPAFHPATLRPHLARVMFNLARGRRDHTFLDPFCGIGGVLIEAGLMGCHVIGIDVKEGMIRNCRKNLRHYQLEGDLIISDAEKLPFKSTCAIDCIATDPPYGTSASTLKRETARMVSSFLSDSLDILKRKSYICIAAPMKIQVSSLGENAGYKIIEKHRLYVHRSLTREIVVFQRI